MRANVKILICCMTLNLGLLWNKKQSSTQIAPCHAMWSYLDDVCNAQGRLASALLWPINCILLLSFISKLYHNRSKDKEMTAPFRIFFDHLSYCHLTGSDHLSAPNSVYVLLCIIFNSTFEEILPDIVFICSYWNENWPVSLTHIA